MKAQQIATLLSTTKGVTFASVTYKSTIATSAANKALNVYKIVTANIQLFNNITDTTSVYANAVKRDANIAEFTVSDNYFEHLQCYSIVKHKGNESLYLYAIYNSVQNSVYYVNDVVVEKQQIEQYLTASALKAFKGENKTHNVTNNVTHNVVVRTIKLDSLISITANKQTIVF